jgi:hypothetical protein
MITDRNFQKQVFYRLAFLKHELINNQMDIKERIKCIEIRFNVNNTTNISSNSQNMSLLNNISNCTFPIDNPTD